MADGCTENPKSIKAQVGDTVTRQGKKGKQRKKSRVMIQENVIGVVMS